MVAKRKHKQQKKVTKVVAVATYNLADIGLAIFSVNFSWVRARNISISSLVDTSLLLMLLPAMLSLWQNWKDGTSVNSCHKSKVRYIITYSATVFPSPILGIYGFPNKSKTTSSRQTLFCKLSFFPPNFGIYITHFCCDTPKRGDGKPASASESNYPIRKEKQWHSC